MSVNHMVPDRKEWSHLTLYILLTLNVFLRGWVCRGSGKYQWRAWKKWSHPTSFTVYLCLSIHLSLSSFVCPSVCPFICLSVCLRDCLSVCLSVDYLSVSLSILVSVVLSVRLSYPSRFLLICISMCLFHSIYVCLSVCTYLRLSVCISVSVSLMISNFLV